MSSAHASESMSSHRLDGLVGVVSIVQLFGAKMETCMERGNFAPCIPSITITIPHGMSNMKEVPPSLADRVALLNPVHHASLLVYGSMLRSSMMNTCNSVGGKLISVQGQRTDIRALV